MNQNKSEMISKNKNKDLHAGHRERMKLRFAADDGESMATHELLEMLLYSVIPRCNTNPIAHALLKQFHSLTGVFEASIADLMQVEGIGRNAAVQIKLINTLIRREECESRIPVKQFLTEQSVIDYIKPLLSHLATERLYLLCFDDAAHLLCCEMISEGTVNAVAVNSQKLLRRIALHNAAWIVLAHNHPHGLPCPTLEDRAITQRYAEVLELAGMQLVEHYISAGGNIFPMLKNAAKKETI